MMRKAGRTGRLLGFLVFGALAVLCGRQAEAGSATLSWQTPTTNVDGTQLTNLAGYKIHYGTSTGVYTNTVDVGKVNTYQIQNLTEGKTYFFTVTDYTTALVESGNSMEVSKAIPISQYALTVAKSGTGSGTVSSSPAGISCGATCSGSFASGTSVTLTASPDPSSTFSGWSGACTGTGVCTVTVNSALNVTAAFAIKTLTITASAGANGSITPSGTVSVASGGSQTFAITPATGYHVTNVLVDSVSAGAVTSYSFTNVAANHTISVTFAANTFTVTPSAGANGSISPATPQTVNQNNTTSFALTPNSGYAIASVTGCGGTLNGNTYTTGPITANCSVSASFAAITPNTLTVAKTGGGTVASAPAGIDCGQTCSSSFAPGASVTLTATPASGWSFTGWSGACTGTGTCSIVMNSTAAVTASFKDVQKPVLTVSALPDGSVTNNPNLNVSGTVTDNGGLKNLLINGNAVSVQNDNTFSALVPLTAGKNTITTTATDLAGNTASDVRSITLDQTVPGLVITSPADNAVTATSIMTVTGTMSESATVSVTLNGGTPQLASPTGTSFSATVILQSGLNTILVTAADAAGNTSASQKRTVVYDDKKPSVSITSPPNDTTTTSSSIPLQGQVTDSLTASTAVISVDGITTALPLDSTGSFSTTAVFPAEGMHTVVVTATNQAGVSASAQRNVQYTMLGDVNASGSVDLADAVLALRDVTGAQLITDPAEKKRCDVAPLGPDGKPQPDGKIDLGDVVIILRRVVGLVTW
jgi:hypothetical protein